MFSSEDNLQDLFKDLLKNPDDNTLWLKIRDSGKKNHKEKLIMDFLDKHKENNQGWHIYYADMIWDTEGIKPAISYLARHYPVNEYNNAKTVAKYLSSNSANKEAIEIYLAFRKVSKRNEVFSSEIARLYYLTGEYVKSAIEYAVFLSSNPIAKDEIEKIILDLSQKKEVRQAVKPVIERKIKDEPNRKYYLLRLLLKIYVMDRDYSSAIKLTTVEGGLTASYLARQMAEAGNENEAIEIIDKGLERKQEKYEKWELILLKMKILSNQKKYNALTSLSQASLDWINKEYRVHTALGYTYSYLAESLYYEKKFNKIPSPGAFQGYIPDNVISPYPVPKPLGFYYIASRIAINDYDNAVKYVEFLPKEWKFMLKGEINCIKKDYENALVCWKQVMNSFPQTDQANKSLLRIYTLENDMQGSKEILTEILQLTYRLEHRKLLALSRNIIEENRMSSLSLGPALMIMDKELSRSSMNREWIDLIIEKKSTLNDAEWTPQILWSILQQEAGINISQSLKLAEEIILRFPKSPVAFQARGFITNNSKKTS